MSPESNSEKVAPLNILVVDDEANVRRILGLALETDGHRVAGVGNVVDALAENSRQSFDLALVDLRLGVDDGLDLIPMLLAAAPWLKVIVITAYASIDTAVEAMRRGASDYIPKPFTPAQIRLAVGKVFALRALEHKLAALQDDLGRTRPETDFSSAEPAMQRAVALARQAAESEATILLGG
jgi:NtrC-family two-component system response regulator AlgB